MPSRPSTRPRSSSPSRGTLAALLLVALLSACNVPNFEGPQIQEPPTGFLLVPDSYPPRRLFPERELAFHAAWVESIDDFSTIYIDGHLGVLGMEDAIAARDGARAAAVDPDVRFGEVEPLRVDGRDAWGWAERVESPTRGLVWVAYRAIVPYDTITYAIEFFSGEPAIKRAAPDTLKAVISTFAIGEMTYNLPLIAVLAGLALFVASAVRTKSKERASRLQAIHLVKLPKKKPDGSSPPEPPPAPPSATAPPASPAGPNAGQRSSTRQS
jgi:hypothetical protein